MASRPERASGSDLILRDEIDELFARANPNPDRRGCPPREVLLAMAKRERPLGDPAYDHLAVCSPCYDDFRRLQIDGATTTTRSWWNWRRLAAAAAVLLLALAGVWFYMFRGNSSPTPVVSTVRLDLDLRPFTVSRSPQDPTAPAPLSLPRSIVSAAISLPTGSEPGTYDVQLRDPQGRAVATASGAAEIRNFITTLQATLDLQGVPSGSYQLALRRPDDDWRSFPAIVR